MGFEEQCLQSACLRAGSARALAAACTQPAPLLVLLLGPLTLHLLLLHSVYCGHRQLALQAEPTLLPEHTGSWQLSKSGSLRPTTHCSDSTQPQAPLAQPVAPLVQAEGSARQYCMGVRGRKQGAPIRAKLAATSLQLWPMRG